MKRILILVILTSIILTGCWDMQEVNERIYPYSVAYDRNYDSAKMYHISFSYPNLSSLGKNSSSDTKIFIVNSEGDSLFDAMHHMSIKTQSHMSLKHLKTIILSDSVASDKKNISEILSGVSNDFEVNKNLQMMVVQGEAKEIIQSTIKSEKQYAIQGNIYTLLLNRQNSTMFTPISTNNFVEDMDISNQAIVPLGYTEGDEIIVKGGAVFKDFELIGYIDGEENRSLAYLNKKIMEDGVVTEYMDSIISLMMTGVKSKKSLVRNNDNIKIIIDIEMEGYLHGFRLEPEYAFTELEDIAMLEAHIEKEMKGNFDKTIKRIQKELRVDSLYIRSYLDKYHNNFWNKIKDNWEEIYPEIEIETNVKVFIRRRGLNE